MQEIYLNNLKIITSLKECLEQQKDLNNRLRLLIKKYFDIAQAQNISFSEDDINFFINMDRNSDIETFINTLESYLKTAADPQFCDIVHLKKQEAFMSTITTFQNELNKENITFVSLAQQLGNLFSNDQLSL